MMLNLKLSHLLPVVIMLSLLSKAFAMAKPQPPITGATRHVDFSGNIFSFAMPENFSRDMPAEALVENLNIDALTKETLIIQRWWDIKEPGFFGSQLGTVMMAIVAVPMPKNTRQRIHDTPYNMRDRVDLMQLVIETLHLRYKDEDGELNKLYSIPGLAYLFGSEVEGEFRESIYNQQKWTSYSINGPASQLIVNHALPLNDDTYLEASFTYSPNDNIQPRYFTDIASAQITDTLENTFHVKYLADNPIKKVVEQDWIDSTTNEALQDMREVIIPKLFGSGYLKTQKK